MDLGAAHRGVDMGPSAIRIAGVSEKLQYQMHSLEIVEANPILDNGNHSAELAVDLIQSGFGKKIF